MSRSTPIPNSESQIERGVNNVIKGHVYREISRLFSSSVITEIAEIGTCKLLKAVLDAWEPSVPDRTLASVFDDLYSLLLREYRCEYVYKNALINKVLLGRHSLSTSTVLTEFRAEDCKVDGLLLNGSSVAYEIKTEMDSLDRLEKQLRSYVRMFDYVYVLANERDRRLSKFDNLTPPKVGTIVLSPDYTLRIRRPAQSNKRTVDPKSIFRSLRRSEYCQIIRENFGSVPDVPNTEIYLECQRLFSLLSPEQAHDGMVKVLKNRVSAAALTQFLDSVPHSLKSLCLATRLTRSQRKSLVRTLSSATF